MREIVLDTETTGFEPEAGDRIVEIGAVELVNHLPTGETFHVYINPERPMPDEAFAVHGLGDDFLRDKPVFAEVADAFLRFVGQARLVIHNAAFDMRFLNHELGRLGHPPIPEERAVDTLALARRRFPGAPASLDALCRRFGIDNSGRTLHGALLDSQLLAEVYLELVGGRQPGLVLEGGPAKPAPAASSPMATRGPRRARPRLLPPRITPEEVEAHRRFVEAMGAGALWAALPRRAD
ncbi:DNA polymerase III subunit epsilon [Rubellimicrobium sp. CFH 75288]|uniref:DNA polymerase III subunit epsilon n=1 Tax=Rubellimicrobium sp. CFH 75288 TaxID=2697034 RepID=UPI001411E23F|nr:DNA polymerase III subunit epsilon [Rubellimicrobium sp. CFH 75288]NAZ37775.1 DNA polymerase III subunit epsilon [Rubellimicrobium sp. CFH 75288]